MYYTVFEVHGLVDTYFMCDSDSIVRFFYKVHFPVFLNKFIFKSICIDFLDRKVVCDCN